jgi:hypothetical protein
MQIIFSCFTFFQKKMSLFCCPCYGNEDKDAVREPRRNVRLPRQDTPHPSPASSSGNEADNESEMHEDTVTFTYHHRERRGRARSLTPPPSLRM